MAIFPHIETEDIVQLNDRTRISASKSFLSKDEAAITLVEIEPEAGNGFIDVTGIAVPLKASDWFLDWEYSTAGTKAVTLRITTDGAPVTESATIEAILESDDQQFCVDQDLVYEEHDIMKWVRPGRNTHKDVIRRAQGLIMKFLDEMGIRDSAGAKITIDAIVDHTEVKEWATYLALYLIFKTNSNQLDDVFSKKSKDYYSKADGAKTRSMFLFDYNGNGTIETGEFAILRTIDVVRR